MNKEHRQKRIQQKENHIAKQLKILKEVRAFPGKPLKQPHRLAKVSCVMCGNPRKFLGEVTIQEEKFKDIQKSYDSEINERMTDDLQEG
jgi:hypothetical protein